MTSSLANAINEVSIVAFRIRVSISDVILCGVTRMTSQVQSRVISICLDYVIQNTDVVYDVVDR